MIVITVATEKGGEGKTSIALEIAYQFSKDRLTMLIDLDAQSSATAQLTGSSNHPKGSYDVLKGAKIEASEVLKKSNWSDNLIVCPADKRLKNIDAELAQTIAKENALVRNFSHIMTKMDIVVIDTPPRIDTATLNALSASDYYLIPCTPTEFGYHAINEIQTAADVVKDHINPKLKSLGIVVNKRSKMNAKAVKEKFQEITQNYNAIGTIRDSVEVEKSRKLKSPVSISKSLISRDFIKLTQNIKECI